MNKSDLEIIWSKLESIDSTDRIRQLIHDDVKSKKPVFKILSETDPQRLFVLLGGDNFEIEMNNWAFEYTYEQYISDYDIEYDEAEALTWDIEEKSIENAIESGHWYVTGTCVINEPEGVEFEFEFGYSDGYPDGIIGTPYKKWKEEDEIGNSIYGF
jgi:hypothetical protein